jgi:DNA-binding transcriptional MerR regulator
MSELAMRTVRLPLAPAAELPSGTDLLESSASPASGGEVGGEAPARLMQIGDLAKETGRTVRAIHLYEELGLLTPAARSKGRYRLYGRESLVRIRWIGRLQELGFSLGDIQTVVREWERIESAPGATRRMREVYARKLDETREQMRRLEKLEHDMQASIEYLDTCAAVCDPERLVSACRCCDLHEKHARDVNVPELVQGFRVRGSTLELPRSLRSKASSTSQ